MNWNLLLKILLIGTGVVLVISENDSWYHDWLQYVYLGGLILFLISCRRNGREAKSPSSK